MIQVRMTQVRMERVLEIVVEQSNIFVLDMVTKKVTISNTTTTRNNSSQIKNYNLTIGCRKEKRVFQTLQDY